MLSDEDIAKFVDVNGDLSLPHYLYRMIMDVMKTSLDLGTLLSDDPAKLRAFKERVKKTHRQKWNELAEILFEMGLIEPCSCDPRNKCLVCGGSRYVTSSFLQADEIREYAVVVSGPDPSIMDINVPASWEKMD